MPSFYESILGLETISRFVESHPMTGDDVTIAKFGERRCARITPERIIARIPVRGAAPDGPVEPCRDEERRAATFKRLP